MINQLNMLDVKPFLEEDIGSGDITAAIIPETTQAHAEVMTRDIITCSPEAGILAMVHLLELHKISAMPVVENGAVLGMVNADLLARKSLAKLLQTQN